MIINGGTLSMNSFDVQIELFLNQFTRRHGWFDYMIGMSDTSDLFKGIVIILLMWIVLFDHNRPGQLRKGYELLIGSAILATFATLVARVLAHSLPFRARPIATPSLNFRPLDDSSLSLINWSAFPSDHATLFFALAAGILLVSQRVGWFAIAWVALVICVPRLCIGIHWPTDILGGAALGVSFIQIARIPVIREFVRRTVANWHQSSPELFFAGLFLWSYETVFLFVDVRHVLSLVAHSL